MAEIESKITATSPASSDPLQLAEIAPMSETDKATTTTTDNAKSEQQLLPPQTDLGEPSIPVPVPAKDTTPSPAEASAKGKEKEEPPPPTPPPAAPVEKPTQPQREDSDSLSIGPSSAAVAPSSPTGDNAPVCSITLLLPTGARHPYRIDERYLAKRNVEIPDVTESGKRDPFSISIYKLKELILREWRDEWDGKPASPSSIRLIHFGKLLDDKEQLKKYQFTADSPNVVHMSVRPAEMMEEDEAGKGKSSAREGRRSEGGSGCCVIL
ncbi:ubiquitin-related domain-containing protein [Apodospora peruviana]|uniref:Ubiquitin-related domain-containing protein n=1 Tax=Apodospora peruviana TaxID=516989 RepID=A0AAE0I6D8_9PEZI|nr:ubiquitin-related domain-containing protein [Apodospora peruviana]